MLNLYTRLVPFAFILLIPVAQLQAADSPETIPLEIEQQQPEQQPEQQEAGQKEAAHGETLTHRTEAGTAGSQTSDPQTSGPQTLDSQESPSQTKAPQTSYLSFDYVDFNYTSSTIDLNASPKKIEGNGFGFALSLGFNPHYALTLSVDASTFNNFQHKAVETIKKTKLGITAHTQIGEATAVYGNASALVAETTVNENSEESGESGMGYELKTGLRHMVSRSIELEFAITHFYVLEYPANSMHIIARYYPYKQVSFGFGYRSGNNQDTIALLARASF